RSPRWRLRRPEPVAGIVGFSGRLAVPERLAEEITARPPVLLTHGDRDEVIPVEAIHEARAALAAVDVPVRWRICQGAGHEIPPEALQLAAEFIHERLFA
ncbi:MAG: prolyl oligopeptidase family serine peptidase, partial [Pseudomonadota bacterium]